MPYLKTLEFNNIDGFTYLKHLNDILEEQNSSNNTGENTSDLSFGRVEEIRYGPFYMLDRCDMQVLFGVCYPLRETLAYLYLRLFGSDN